MATSEDALVPVYYRVTINALDPNILGSDWVSNTQPDVTRGENDDGFIDNTTPEEYGGADDADFPTDLDRSLEKERANMRWEEILIQVSDEISPMYVLDIEKTGSYSSYFSGNPQDAPPDIFSFTLVYDRPGYLRTNDENNSGEFLTNDGAIKRWISRALSKSMTRNRRVYNPDTPRNTDNIREVTAASIGTLSNVEDNIGVVKIDHT